METIARPVKINIIKRHTNEMSIRRPHKHCSLADIYTHLLEFFMSVFRVEHNVSTSNMQHEYIIGLDRTVNDTFV